MRQLFLEAVQPSIEERFRKILKSKDYKRKFISFDWCSYKDQYQFGIVFCIQRPDPEAERFFPEGLKEVIHAHLWIDFFKWCFEITFMDYV